MRCVSGRVFLFPLSPRRRVTAVRAQHRAFLGKLFLHASDLSNPVLPVFSVVEAWATRVCAEFSAQVDDERRLGLPFAPHMADLNTPLKVAKLQVQSPPPP